MLHRTPRRLVALGLFTLVACQDSNDSPADGSTGPVDGGTTTGGYTTSTSSSSTTEDPHTAGPETGSSSSDGSGGEQDESTDATGEDHASTGEVVSELDGLWQTEGYGWIYAVDDGALKIYETTAISCVQAIGGTVVAQDGEGSAILEVPELFTLGMEILAGESPETKHFLADGLLVAPPAHRVDALPETCSEPAATDDRAVFEVVVRTFEEHYALFGDREVDWNAWVDEQRARLMNDAPDALFEVLVDLLAPLEDAHVSLQTPEGSFEGRRAEVEPVTEDAIDRARTIIATHYLQDEPTWAVGDQIAFGHLTPEVGYLAADGFGPLFTEEGQLDYAGGVAALETFLDEIFAESGMEGLVIDLRMNGGGSDLYGLAIAQRLTRAPYSPYVVSARVDPVDRSVFGEPVPIVVEPSDRPHFEGEVVVLIGRDTVSAAEAFALALRGRPGITLVGEPSQGAFSAVLNHFLPNGWMLGLPNEHYVTPEGERFDVVGIPPDVTTPVFGAEDLAAERDSALDEALRLLTE